MRRKYCYFFCYEGAIGAKKVKKKTRKSQDLGLDTFFVKGSNMENIATNAGTEN